LSDGVPFFPLNLRGWHALLDSIAPLLCPLCGERLMGSACRACRLPDAALGRRQLRVDRQGPFLLLAGGPYEGALRRLVQAYKYRADPGAAAILIAQTHHGWTAAAGWDALVPVPAPWQRRRIRGADAVAGLAAGLARRTGVPVRRCLRRAAATPPLAGRRSIERRRLVRGAFRARGASGHLLVVDDVATTGATFRAARRVLLAGGARSVDLLVAAATPRRMF
jgi:predicted amidophosphoribosyltransferase